MKFRLTILITIISILLVIESIAYFWMHPSRSDAYEKKLVWSLAIPGSSTISEIVKSKNASGNVGKITFLPEICDKTISTLGCSFGTVARIDFEDGISMHTAFFGWNSSDSSNVLEAFKHLPEKCMGSIGMKLVRTMVPHLYTIDGEQVYFDHTIFRDQVGRTIHAFKGTWVSGATKIIGKDFRGGSDQWRQIRLKAAWHRFKPSFCRVAQGAVSGVSDSELAWQTFEEGMLKELSMR